MTAKIQPGDGDPRHGTANGYHNLDCRCPACTEAWRVRHREYMHADPARTEKARERGAFLRKQQGMIPRDETRGPRWPLCDVEGCERRATTQGLCGGHYSRLRKIGDVIADVPIGALQGGAQPKATCSRGHAMEDPNLLYARRPDGRIERRCKTCHYERQRRYDQDRRRVRRRAS